MTNQTMDPIAEIKTAEENAKKKIEDSKRDFIEKINEFKEELSTKTNELEESLKQKGTAKLKNIKNEAGELYKSKIATFESERNKTLSDAKSKKPEAIKQATSFILDHIRS